ncbi:MAG: ice-binding family protein, partial [Minisyncoccia bacterium]
MKKFNKVLLVVFAITFMFGVVGLTNVQAATNPSLGAAGSFSILAQTAITGISTISGDVGMNNNGASISALLPANVVGTIYSTDGGAPSTAIINPAVQANASTAYTATIPGLPIEGTPIVVSELNGITRGPGVYDLPAGAVTLSGGVLTLDGPGTYIFRITTGLTSSGSINFINGARACDLFWNVGSLATINGTSFAGTILAGTGVHFGPGVTLDGRALAVGGDVTLGVGGVISGPTCAASTATLTLVKSVTNDNGGALTIADFPLTATGPTTITGISGAGAVTNATVSAGAYTLSETINSGYTPSTYSCVVNGSPAVVSNSLTLSGGDVATCTITNDDIAPQIIVNKIVVNDDSGSKLFSDFSLFVDGVGVTHGVVTTTTIGAHTISETP